MIAHPSPQSYAAPGTTTRWVTDYRFASVMVLMIWAEMILMIVPENINNPDAAFGTSLGIYRIVKLVLIALGGLLVLWRVRLSWLLLRSLNPFLICFVLLAAASFLWSIEPEATIQRMIGLSAMSLVSLSFALVSWRRTRFQDLLRPVLTTILFGSIVVAIVWPAIGVESGTTFTLNGSWRGMTFQKNALGHLAGFGLVLWVHAWLSHEKKVIWSLIGAGIALICLLGSRSSTSVLSATIACLLMLLLQRAPPNVRRYMPMVSIVFMILVLTYALAVLKVVPGLDALLTPITKLTGKDQTFSNRSVIWEIIVEHIKQAPFLGTGYGAYWIGPVPWSPSFVFMTRMYFYPTQAHNGYLETINDLGYVGLIVLLGFLIIYIRQALHLFRLDRSQGALFLALFFLQAIENLSEANWFQSTSFEWVIMMISSAALGRALLEHKLQRYYGQPSVAMPDRRARMRTAYGAGGIGRGSGDGYRR